MNQLDSILKIANEIKDPHALDELHLITFNNRKYKKSAKYLIAAAICKHVDIIDYLSNIDFNFTSKLLSHSLDNYDVVKTLPIIIKAMEIHMKESDAHKPLSINLCWEYNLEETFEELNIG